MQLLLKDIQGENLDPVSANDAIFGVPFNRSLVHQAMVMYQSNQRQGTSNTKTRKEVSGGGAKPWRQKHTGRARQGSTRSPQWRHGGIVFGPKPRSHRREMPRKMRQLALKCMLSQRAREGKLLLINNLGEMNGRTKTMGTILESIEVFGPTLVVTKGSPINIIRASRNLPRIWTVPIEQLNSGIILKYGNLILTLDAFHEAEIIWAKKDHDVGQPQSVAQPSESSETNGNHGPIQEDS